MSSKIQEFLEWRKDNMKIKLELLSEALNTPIGKLRYNDITCTYEIYKDELFNWNQGEYGRWSNINMNIFEFVHLDLKYWSKRNNILNNIDWSEGPDQIISACETLFENLRK